LTGIINITSDEGLKSFMSKNSKQYKDKTYRIIKINDNVYSGKDREKKRTPGYIFNGFPHGYLKDKSILDLGCASGAILFEAMKYEIAEGFGVEIDPVKLNIGKEICKIEKMNKLSLFNCDILNYLEKCGRQFNCIFILNILHHLPFPFLVLDYIMDLSTDYICIETPMKAAYMPYPRDKKMEKQFNKPLSIEALSDYLLCSNWKLAYKNESENQSSFKGGDRCVILFKK